MRVRTYGNSGSTVVLLHGGPGASGHMAPVARELADSFHILEPFQRDSGDEPLTVARHVQDVRELLDEHGAMPRPALIGASWGAMLALAFAAAHPDRAGPLVLIGCGTFDLAARHQFRANLHARTSPDLQRQLDRLETEIADPDERFRRVGELLLEPYSFDPISDELECERCDTRGNRETWADMIHLQANGVYPQAFAAIHAPVLMLHGAVDPHPGAMIHDSLKPYLPQLEYHEWERCGHYPWLERAVRDEFFAMVRAWLSDHMPANWA